MLLLRAPKENPWQVLAAIKVFLMVFMLLLEGKCEKDSLVICKGKKNT